MAIAFGVMVWLTSDPERRADVERLVESPAGLLVLFGLAALSSATLILPAPGLALTAVAGAAGNPIAIGIVAGLGQAIGELTGYAAGASGRSLLPDTPAAHRLSDLVARRGYVVIFLLGVVAGLGQAIGELTGYAAGASGRSLLPDTPAAHRLSDLVARRGYVVIFLLALVPNPLFDVAGIAAGALRMPVSRYLVAAAAGKIVKNVVVAGGAARLNDFLSVLSLG